MDTLGANDRSALAVELMRMIALLGPLNGHSAIDPLGEHPITLHAFPLWLYEFDDGVFVVDAGRGDLIGTELVAVEGADVNEVLRAVTHTDRPRQRLDDPCAAPDACCPPANPDRSREVVRVRVGLLGEG